VIRTGFMSFIVRRDKPVGKFGVPYWWGNLLDGREVVSFSASHVGMT
jgi:hypothetical protein